MNQSQNAEMQSVINQAYDERHILAWEPAYVGKGREVVPTYFQGVRGFLIFSNFFVIMERKGGKCQKHLNIKR